MKTLILITMITLTANAQTYDGMCAFHLKSLGKSVTKLRLYNANDMKFDAEIEATTIKRSAISVIAECPEGKGTTFARKALRIANEI